MYSIMDFVLVIVIVPQICVNNNIVVTKQKPMKTIFIVIKLHPKLLKTVILLRF